MASVAVNGAGLVFVFDHDEVDGVASGAKALGGSGGLVTGALAAGGVTAPAALVTGVISAYFGAQAWLIQRVDRGCGVYLTLPWPAIWFGQIYLIIPTTHPCEGPLPPARWSEQDSGEFGTEDPVDLINWNIIRSSVDPQIVVFELQLGYNSSGWKKILNMPDGAGNSWDITADGKGVIASNSLWANQTGQGQQLTFRKAKFLGIMTDVLRLGDLGGLRGGDSVRFTWQRDE